MTLPIYATRADLTRYGLPAGALVAQPRTLVSVDAAGDGLTLEQHGLVDGDRLTFVGDELPAPLSPSTNYFAIVVSPDVFKVSTTLGGSTIDVTSTGAAPIGVRASNDATIAACCARRSRYIDEALTAHASPLAVPYPLLVVGWVAQLVAADLVRILGLANSQYRESVQPILDAAAAVERELAPYRAGKPLDELASTGDDATPNVSENVAVAWSDGGRGWSNRGRL